MGSLGSKAGDLNVELYLEVSKPSYNAGENVEGIAYLIAKNNIQYHTLSVTL